MPHRIRTAGCCRPPRLCPGLPHKCYRCYIPVVLTPRGPPSATCSPTRSIEQEVRRRERLSSDLDSRPSSEIRSRSQLNPTGQNCSWMVASCKGGKEMTLSAADPNSVGLLRDKEGEDSMAEVLCATPHYRHCHS